MPNKFWYKGPQILDINVTQTSLLMTKRAIDLFGATDTEGDRAEKVKSVSRHDIANSLGFKIMVWNEDSVLCPELATREIERVRRFKNFTIKALRKLETRGSVSIEIPHGKREPLHLSINMPMLIMLSKHLRIWIIQKTKI